MSKQKKWEIASNENISLDNIANILLANRGITTQDEQKTFLRPDLSLITNEYVSIDSKQMQKAVKRIQKAIEKQEKIIVFGDYDVDGITGTAILWETLHALGANASPYIPHRVDEGYGLSQKGIENVKEQYNDTALIITVDNGIVAHGAVEYANTLDIDVIITDHHVPSETLPQAYAIVHTTKLCGAGVGWMMARELSDKEMNTDHLALVTLATIADLVPLKEANRIVVSCGLDILRTTSRVGIKALCEEAQIDQSLIDVYTIGHIIAPRLNAMGRLESAMDSLRILCTNNKERAQVLAQTLGQTNRQRQLLTRAMTLHARQLVLTSSQKQKILFIVHDTYDQGVIGLIAGKLVEEFYLPAIVIAKKDTRSKASARSISGFNIIEFIRSGSEYLVDAGGHPMAAGFTIETEKITLLEKFLHEKAESIVTEDHLTRVLKIDCAISLGFISPDLFEMIKQLAPFGMGNPEPVFMSRDVIIETIQTVGKEKNHLKLQLKDSNDNHTFNAIAFGLGDRCNEFTKGDKVSLVYTIDENTWNGRTTLQLKIKDIKLSSTY